MSSENIPDTVDEKITEGDVVEVITDIRLQGTPRVSSLPTADATHDEIIHEQGASSADILFKRMKDSSDAYDWEEIHRTA